jgi:hypothetical protein
MNSRDSDTNGSNIMKVHMEHTIYKQQRMKKQKQKQKQKQKHTALFISKIPQPNINNTKWCKGKMH